MEQLENTILKNLIHNEEYARKVLPFVFPEYFTDRIDKIIFETVNRFITKYNNLPTIEALTIDVGNNSELKEEEFQSTVERISSLSKEKDEKPDNAWLLESTEKFCQDKAIYNAVVESIGILDETKTTPKRKDAIPTILSDALSVSFDPHIGHDYICDVDDRYDYYHKVETKIPFDLEYFNKITKNGLPLKTLNIALAGCVHPDTKITVRIKHNSSLKEINISEVEQLLKDGHEVEVDSPDGFVPVTAFVDKGIYEEYLLKMEDDTIIRSNENHLYETPTGWEYAKDLVNKQSIFLTRNGHQFGHVTKTDNKIPIVDITVNHPKHRYYTESVSSHNTGVGKSLFMCHMAASCLSQNYNVLYITLEMAEEKIAERIDANLLGIPLDDLSQVPKDIYDRKFKKLRENIKGRLIIKEYPTATAGTSHFRHLFNELHLKKSFKPNIVLIDYLNICISSRIKPGAQVNSYTYIKSIAEELRGLAVEYNIPIVSATQTTRAAFCLDLESKIITKTGIKSLKDIQIGDEVLSNKQYNSVKTIFPIKKKKMYKITTESGKEIICSEEHFFPTKDGIEKNLQNSLSINDELFVL